LIKGADSGCAIRLSLIVPVLNEVETVNLFIDKVTRIFEKQLTITLEFIFVNDGSTDSTLEKLLVRQQHDFRVKVIDLSRNFCKEAALTAGLMAAEGDVMVPIDVDLQIPLNSFLK
jgi:polyisoprenyl-phosphate glycosyltransferase